MRWLFSLFLLVWNVSLFAEALWLRENLQTALPGSYLVTSCNKTLTLLLVREQQGSSLVLEEICASEIKMRGKPASWKEWVANGAPQHTSWVLYDIDLTTGQMNRCYSFTKQSFFTLSQAHNFLGTLLSLSFMKIPDEQRKRTGWTDNNAEIRDGRRFWQPPMIVEGRVIEGVLFDAWKAHWPKDGSELSGKMIEVYLPRDCERYATYFPYWLQITGTTGRAKVRIIDSGASLQSPQPSFSEL